MARPAFLFLAASPVKDKYFVRTCQWEWMDEKNIVVHDKYHPRVITLDPWPQAVYLEATGDRTVAEFIEYMASLYSGKIPEELDEVILTEIDKLVKEKIIELKDEGVVLADEILLPRR